MYQPQVLSVLIIAGCLMTSALLYAGSVGILAAVLRIDWRLRLAVAFLPLAPLLLLPAVELFWMLSLQALLVAYQIRIADRFLLKRHLMPEQPDASRTKRFSIATMLFLTALIAVVVMLIQVTPALTFEAWQSHLLMAVLSSSCVLAAWIVVHSRWAWWKKWPLAIGAACGLGIPLALFDWLLPMLQLQHFGWPPDPWLVANVIGTTAPTLSWVAIQVAILLYTSLVLYVGCYAQKKGWSARLFSATLLLPVIASLGWTFSELLPPRQDLPEKLEANLAWERVIELTQKISNSSFVADDTKYGGWETMSDQQLNSSVAPIEDQIDDLIQELRQPIASPLAYRPQDTFSYLQSIRTSARALLAFGKTKALAQQPDEATEAYLSIARLGLKSRQGGIILDELLGRAVSSNSTSPLYKARYSISDTMRFKVCNELAEMLSELEPLALFMERDLQWTRSQSWHTRLQVLIDLWSGANWMVGDGAAYATFRSEELAELRLVILELALSGYAIDHGAFPENLEVLVPQYLCEVPLDPFAQGGQGFRYTVSDIGYQLYSIGQNRVDDGGMPYPSDPASGMVDRSVGDLSLKQIAGN